MERRENSKKSGEKHLSVGVKHKKNEKPDKQSYINDWLTGVSKQQDEGRRDETDLLEEYQPGEFDRSHDVKHKHKHKHKTNILTKISKQVSKKGLTKSDSSFIANWLSQLSQTIKGNQEHKDEAVIKHGRRKSQGLNQPKVRDIGTATSKENMKKKIRFRSEDSCIQEYESNIGHSKDRKEEEPKRDSHASNWFSKLPRIKIILEKGGVKHELGGVKHKQDEDDDDTYNEVKEPAAPAGDTRSEEKEYRAAERKGILKNPIAPPLSDQHMRKRWSWLSCSEEQGEGDDTFSERQRGPQNHSSSDDNHSDSMLNFIEDTGVKQKHNRPKNATSAKKESKKVPKVKKGSLGPENAVRKKILTDDHRTENDRTVSIESRRIKRAVTLPENMTKRKESQASKESLRPGNDHTEGSRMDSLMFERKASPEKDANMIKESRRRPKKDHRSVMGSLSSSKDRKRHVNTSKELGRKHNKDTHNVPKHDHTVTKKSSRPKIDDYSVLKRKLIRSVDMDNVRSKKGIQSRMKSPKNDCIGRECPKIDSYEDMLKPEKDACMIEESKISESQMELQKDDCIATSKKSSLKLAVTRETLIPNKDHCLVNEFRRRLDEDDYKVKGSTRDDKRSSEELQRPEKDDDTVIEPWKKSSLLCKDSLSSGMEIQSPLQKYMSKLSVSEFRKNLFASRQPLKCISHSDERSMRHREQQSMRPKLRAYSEQLSGKYQTLPKAWTEQQKVGGEEYQEQAVKPNAYSEQERVGSDLNINTASKKPMKEQSFDEWLSQYMLEGDEPMNDSQIHHQDYANGQRHAMQPQRLEGRLSGTSDVSHKILRFSVPDNEDKLKKKTGGTQPTKKVVPYVVPYKAQVLPREAQPSSILEPTIEIVPCEILPCDSKKNDNVYEEKGTKRASFKKKPPMNKPPCTLYSWEEPSTLGRYHVRPTPTQNRCCRH